MADRLRSLDNQKELDAIREQIVANALKSDKMFEDIRNLIAAMATNPNPLGSAATMDNEGHSPVARDMGTSSQGYHLPTKRSKVEFPSFNGEDLRGWLFRAEQFFEVDETPMETRVRLAIVYLEGKALQWHQNFMRTRIDKRMPNWGKYVTALQDRFGSFLFEVPMANWCRSCDFSQTSRTGPYPSPEKKPFHKTPTIPENPSPSSHTLLDFHHTLH
ncbi:hypothetical protein BUALT_Bualt04G0072100 [Buddleja alternifolia]|uniref:Retrotransposon gag domain-containing protein n=1 Tax=Buddleja alternifolia TaxID=168488 RepID=A0AAV6XP03_9LAMI|nr:hypothetical protein BUALT_Bualt04G0072100 [Buddleja alternifolia]